MKNRLLMYLMIFVAAWMVVSLFAPAPSQQATPGEERPVMLEVREPLRVGDPVLVTMRNNTEQPISLEGFCPNPPLTIYYQDEQRMMETPFRCPESYEVPAGGRTVIDLAPWASTIFKELGTYRIVYETTEDGEERTYSTFLRLEAKGFFAQAWDSVFYRPIYNTLIYLTTVVPGGNLGWAIILLTIIFRVILLIPNQRAMESQKSMQRMQPELKALQEKYKEDQQRLAQETMKLWKKHKVNPMGSCLPLLIQLPILIAIYYAVQNGTNIVSMHLLYEPLSGVNLEMIRTLFIALPFYTLDLALRDPFVLPILVAGLQFIQMKLALPKGDTKQLVIKKEGETAMPDMQMVNKVMVYTLPLLLGFMTATFPAGVGLYWMVNTLFGIGQQLVVNKTRA